MEPGTLYISLWLDAYTDATDPQWIVSLDICDQGSTPLAAFQRGSYKAARSHAIAIGAEKKLPVYEVDMENHGKQKLLTSKERPL